MWIWTNTLIEFGILIIGEAFKLIIFYQPIYGSNLILSFFKNQQKYTQKNITMNNMISPYFFLSLLIQPYFFFLHSFNRHEFFNLILKQIANKKKGLRTSFQTENFSEHSSVCKLVHLGLHSLKALVEAQAYRMWNQPLSFQLLFSGDSFFIFFTASFVIHHKTIQYQEYSISLVEKWRWTLVYIHIWILYIYIFALMNNPKPQCSQKLNWLK